MKLFGNCADEDHWSMNKRFREYKKEKPMSKVRGMKISEFEFGGAVFAVVKLSDDCEGEFVSPGSDQADAVLRLEGLAEILECEVEELEEQCELAVKIAEGAEGLCNHLDAKDDLLDPQVGDIFIVGTDGEINDFIRAFIGCDQ